MQPGLHVAILLPVHDDWVPAGKVLAALDAEFAGREGWAVDAYLVDDGSVRDPEPGDLPASLGALRSVTILPLRRNLGHQRAIAIGLAYLEAKTEADVVVVMDADGEDRPADVPRLVDRLLEDGQKRVVFAQRRRRTEGPGFLLGYACYRLLHRLLVGPLQKVGNFSAVPRRQLQRVVVVSETWNHYAAAVFKSRIPLTMLPADRGERLHGRSRMNALSLVVHGLSALAVYGEVVGVRLLVGSTTLALTGVVGAVVLLGVHLRTGLALPPWSETLAILATVLMTQAASVGFLTAFYLLALRSRLDFVPARDFQVFLGDPHEVVRRDG